MLKIPRDNRTKTWAIIDDRIQHGATSKDKRFVLSGKWKKFVRNDSGYKVFSVDGEWIRNNLCSFFAHGGHGLVHEFIPHNEIWISSRHYNSEKNDDFNCPCETHVINQKVSKNYFDSSVLHEITENLEMRKGKKYWPSHQIALEKERQAGLITDPFSDL